MDLNAMPNPGGAERQFPATNHGAIDGERKEDVGIAYAIVVEEVGGVGLEVVGIESPSANGDGYSELMFFVPLSVQGNETKILRCDELE